MFEWRRNARSHRRLNRAPDDVDFFRVSSRIHLSRISLPSPARLIRRHDRLEIIYSTETRPGWRRRRRRRQGRGRLARWGKKLLCSEMIIIMPSNGLLSRALTTAVTNNAGDCTLHSSGAIIVSLSPPIPSDSDKSTSSLNSLKEAVTLALISDAGTWRWESLRVRQSPNCTGNALEMHWKWPQS